MFSIISFGNDFEYLFKVDEPYAHTSENLKAFSDEVDKFEADFGGTNI